MGDCETLDGWDRWHKEKIGASGSCVHARQKVNIFSLHRIRSKGACGFAFHGVPKPEGVIQIFNRLGEQIATVKETVGPDTIVRLVSA